MYRTFKELNCVKEGRFYRLTCPRVRQRRSRRSSPMCRQMLELWVYVAESAASEDGVVSAVGVEGWIQAD